MILIQELRTNVESLGRVCRIFDGVFRRAARDRVVRAVNEATGVEGEDEGLGLDGVEMVCLRFRVFFCFFSVFFSCVVSRSTSFFIA